LLVFGPELAMLKIPLELCDKLALSSSSKGLPQHDCPPVPVPVGSPPCIYKDNLSFNFEMILL